MKKIYINYYDIIDPQRAKDLMGLINNIYVNNQPTEINLLLSSPGGDVNAGITIYNFLKALPCTINVYNTGSIDSIATVVFLAGKNRYAAPHTTFHFHGVTMQTTQNSSFTLHQGKELISRLEEDQNKILGIYTSESKLLESEVRDIFVKGEAKNLEFALDKGIIHEVRAAHLDPDDVLITCNFVR